MGKVAENRLFKEMEDLIAKFIIDSG